MSRGDAGVCRSCAACVAPGVLPASGVSPEEAQLSAAATPFSFSAANQPKQLKPMPEGPPGSHTGRSQAPSWFTGYGRARQGLSKVETVWDSVIRKVRACVSDWSASLGTQ